MLPDLNAHQKRLLTSFFLFGLAAPMASVFTNTFLWRQSNDLMTLAIFNIGIYITLALGFLMNAYLLRYIQSGRLYGLGCLLQGIVPLIIILLGRDAKTFALPLGLALGIAQGFFWSNRNALTSKLTQASSRYQFISIETALGLLAGIVSPPLIGWFIASGATHATHTVNQAYVITSLIGLALMVAAGVLAWSFNIEAFKVKQIFLKHASPLWHLQRIIEIVNGVSDGIMVVLPLIIILLFLGNEDAVGLIQAATAILSASVIVAIGKRVRDNDHAMLFAIWILCNLLGAMFFAMFYSPSSALISFFLSGLVAAFRWSSIASVMYEVIDHEVVQSKTHRYIFLVDREFYLNFGRVVGLILLILAYRYSHEIVIRYGLIVLILIATPLVPLIKETTNRLAHIDRTKKRPA